jgi:hypothetical protein
MDVIYMETDDDSRATQIIKAMRLPLVFVLVLMD